MEDIYLGDDEDTIEANVEVDELQQRVLSAQDIHKILIAGRIDALRTRRKNNNFFVGYDKAVRFLYDHLIDSILERDRVIATGLRVYLENH